MSRAWRIRMAAAALAVAFAARAAGEPPPLPPAGAPGVLRLTLREAAQMAIAANLRLRAGAYDPLMARARSVSAAAAFDTLLTVGFDVAHNETPETLPFFGRDVVAEDTVRGSAGLRRRLPSGGEVALLYEADRLSTDSLFVTTNPAWTHGVAFEARQPLLRGAGDAALADIRRARNGVCIADHAQRALTEQVLVEVAEAYWELAFAQEQVGSRTKAESVGQELLSDQQARLDAQVVTPLEVADARAGFEQRRGDRIVAENAFAAAADRLRRLVLPFTAEEPGGPLLVAAEDPRTPSQADPDPARLDAYARTALAARAEVAAAQADLGNRTIDVVVAADAVRPQLDVTGRVGTAGLAPSSGAAFRDAANGEAVSARVGIELSMFLGQRAARAQLNLAEWARRQAALRERELESQVVAEVRAAVRDVRTARAVMEAGRAEVDAAGEGLGGERQRLTQDRSTPFRVLEKEQLLTDAVAREGRAAASYRIAQARFARAMGTLAGSLGVSP